MGLFRFLRKEVSFKPIVPLLALLFDAVILIAFMILKFKSDPLVLIVSFVGILIVIIAEKLFMKTHTDSDGEMNMEMDMKE